MRTYRVTTERTLTAAGLLLVLEVHSTKLAVLLGAKVQADRGSDGASEQLKISVDRCDTSGGGTAASIRKVDPGDAASLCTAHDGSGAAPTIGANLDAENVNEAGGYAYEPRLEMQDVIAPGQGVVIRMTSSPAGGASTVYTTTLEFAELG